MCVLIGSRLCTGLNPGQVKLLIALMKDAMGMEEHGYGIHTHTAISPLLDGSSMQDALILNC